MAGANQPPSSNNFAGERKLTAVLHADIAGYSRLMGEDETGTHGRLKAYRAVMDEFISAHGGRIVGTAGDAVLADFASVGEALNAAVEVQAALADRNGELPEDKRLEFRIGINLGDVIVDGDDIFGNGVNVAARVEALADPGGIAVSGSVHDLMSDRSDLSFRDLGTHRVKNIAQPVRVFAVATAGSGGAARRARPVRLVAISLAVAAVILAGIAAAAWMLWPELLFPGQRAEQAAGTASATIERGRPVVAVLPFENRVGDPEQAYFSDGLTEDVIVQLGRFSGLVVLSWNAVAPYKDKTVEPGQLREDLNADYVVSGSVRRASERLRVTVQLTGVRDGVLLWSQRYDRQIEEVFAVQDEITRHVVGALAVNVTRLEEERAFSQPTANLSAYDRVLRGRDLLRRVDRDANLESRQFFNGAIEIDPRYADAYLGLGWTYANDFKYGWSQWPDRALEQAEELATRAVSLDGGNAAAHALFADVLRFRQRFEEAERQIVLALELNPNDATSHAIHGSLLVWSGKPEDAVEPLETALRLDPKPHTWWLVNLAHAYYFLGRYEDSVRLFDRFGGLHGEDPAAYAVMAAAHGQLGQGDEAAGRLEELERVSPFFDADSYASHFANPENGELLLDGLRKAGWAD